MSCLFYQGVVLTHSNLTSALRSVLSNLSPEPDDMYIAYLPLAHVLELLGEKILEEIILRGINPEKELLERENWRIILLRKLWREGNYWDEHWVVFSLIFLFNTYFLISPIVSYSIFLFFRVRALIKIFIYNWLMTLLVRYRWRKLRGWRFKKTLVRDDWYN